MNKLTRVLILGLVIVVLVGVGLLAALPFVSRGTELPIALPTLIEGDFVVKVYGEDGKFIPGSRVNYNGTGLGRTYGDRFIKPDGTLKLPFKRSDAKSLSLTASAPGHSSMQVQWGQNQQSEIPAEFTFTMRKGAVIGGTVLNPQEETVRGVKVSVNYGTNQQEQGKVQVAGEDSVQTDANGKWKMKTVPAEAEYVQVSYSHPYYISERGQNVSKDDLARYRKFTVEHTLREGLKVVGIVTDPAGKPVAKAFVVMGAQPSQYYRNTRIPTTRSDGRFELRNARPGSELLTVLHPDWAIAQREISIGENMEQVEFQLAKGERIELVIKNQSQKPVAGASVYPSQWNGSSAINFLARNAIPVEADENGRVVWEHAPPGEIDYYVSATDYAFKGDLKLTARKEPHEIILSPPRKIIGEVVDARTRDRITTFKTDRGYKFEGNDRLNWQGWQSQENEDGKFEITESGNNEYAIRVQAEGYLAAVSPVFTRDMPTATHRFELVPGVGPEGEVYTADGKPVEGATVAVYTAESNARIYNGEIQESDVQTAKTGANGRFKLNPQSLDYAIVAVHATGYAQTTQAELTKSTRLILQPWSKVEGQVLLGKEPQAGVNVNLNSMMEYREGEPNLYANNSNVTTNEKGKFSVDRVLPGMGSAYLIEMVESPEGNFGYMTRSAPFEVAPGETAQIMLGGSGRPVVGKIVVPEDLGAGVDLTQGYHSIQEKPKEEPGESPNNNRRQAMLKNFQFRLKEDGTFRVEDIPAGDYQLRVYIRQPNPPQANPRQGGFFGGGQMLGQLRQDFTVADVPEGEEPQPVDLGDLEVKPIEQQNRF